MSDFITGKLFGTSASITASMQSAAAVRPEAEALADHVEHGIIIEGISNLLELFQKSLENSAFDCIGRHEVEDQAILPLTVAVDASHSLF